MAKKRWFVLSLHVGVGHPALKKVLKAGNAFKSLAGDAQHRK